MTLVNAHPCQVWAIPPPECIQDELSPKGNVAASKMALPDEEDGAGPLCKAPGPSEVTLYMNLDPNPVCIRG